MADADPARERRIGFLCALLLIVVWAGFHVAARLGVSQQVTPWDMGALRMGGAFLGGLALLLWFRPPRLPLPRALALAATAGFGFPLFAYAGYVFAPAAHGAVLMAGVLPFATAILASLFLAERFTARQAAALVAVGLGAALLGADMWGDHPGAWVGDLLFVCAILCWALFTLLIRRWRVPPMEGTLTVALFCAPVYLPLWWWLLPSTLGEAPPGAVAFQALWQGVAAVIVAGFLFARAVKALGPVVTTTITAAVPPVAALAAWPLLGEALGPLGLAGVAVVAAGMALGVGGPARR